MFLRSFHHYPYDGMNRIRFQGLRHWPLSALFKAPPVKRSRIFTVFASLLSIVKHVAVHQQLPTLYFITPKIDLNSLEQYAFDIL